MKKLIISIMIVVLSFCLFGCDITNNNATDNKKIIYSTNFGTKIENLSASRQSQISDYIADCKVLFIKAYKEKAKDFIEEPFVDFTDAFVYDFRNVNENNLDEESLLIWEQIKEFRNNEAKPLMYIQINGYCSYFNDYVLTNFEEVAMLNGYLIYNDNTVVSTRYRYMSASVFVYKLVKGTTIINCGNKYSQKNNSTDIKNFDGKLKKLTYTYMDENYSEEVTSSDSASN